MKSMLQTLSSLAEDEEKPLNILPIGKKTNVKASKILQKLSKRKSKLHLMKPILYESSAYPKSEAMLAMSQVNVKLSLYSHRQTVLLFLNGEDLPHMLEAARGNRFIFLNTF